MMLVIPITVKAQTPTQTPAQAQVPAAEVIPEAEIRQAIDQYIDRFKAMDLDLFMEVFSKQAVDNRMLPYADMREAVWSNIQEFKSNSVFSKHLGHSELHK